MIRKNIYRLAAVATFLCAAASAEAQNLDPTVVVSRDYEGKLMEVHKPKIEMAIPDSVLRFDLEFDYSVSDSPYKGAYDFTPYMLDMKPSPAYRENGRFYLNAGAGYQLHPELDMVWTPRVKNDAFRMNVYARHRSYVGKWWDINPSQAEDGFVFDRNADKTRWKGSDMVTRAGLDGRYDWKRAAFRFEAGYYGLYQCDTSAAGRSFNALDLRLGLASKGRSVKSLGYSFDLAYRYGKDAAGDALALSENLLVFDASLHSSSAKGHLFRLDFDYQLSGYQGYFDTNASLVTLTPHYVMKFRRWDIDLGVAAAWKLPTAPESGMYGKNIQNLYPDVRIAFKGARSFDMYFELGGGAVMNTYSSLLASDRRFGMLYGRGQGALLEMTDERIRAVLGVDGRITSRFSYELKGGYSYYGNAPMGAIVRNADEAGSVWLPALVYGAYGKAFINLDWKLRAERIDFDGVLEYASCKGKSPETDAFLPAAFTGDVSFRYNWRKRVYAGVNCNFSSEREGKVRTYSQEGVTYTSAVIPGYADLGVELEGRLNHKISLWAKGGNLLNMTIQRSLMYAEAGPYFTLGFCLNL